MEKQCTKCGEIKVETEFYKNHRNKDGYFGSCKSCVKEYAKIYSKTEKARAYQKKYRATIDPLKKREERKRYRLKNKKKSRVHDVVYYAIKTGKLNRDSCEVCSAEGAYAHHDDYDKPLDVRWLCNRCHQIWHRDNGEGLNAR